MVCSAGSSGEVSSGCTLHRSQRESNIKVTGRTVLSYVGNKDRLCRILSYNLDDHRLLMLHHGMPDVVCMTNRLVDAVGDSTT